MEDNSVKISDEQYAKVGVACGWAEAYAVEQGKRAVAAVAPLLLAEPSDTEMMATATDARTNWKFGSEGDYGRVRRIFANRLASLTAKPDPAVEAVEALWLQHDGNASAEQIVAAIDAARGGK